MAVAPRLTAMGHVCACVCFVAPTFACMARFLGEQSLASPSIEVLKKKKKKKKKKKTGDSHLKKKKTTRE
eukprot:NODE_22362_length_711_cov_6.505137.p3 GENE.NODE_22362_length_711_cov_6.505137~~NODE_22362_length_711_cov_6.505137.p3  ORF type:complete len:70 (-),score=36.97 NODE_22362_length_711_cov_6.505137:96-305(-)